MSEALKVKPSEEKKDFKKTLNLPHTEFPIRAQPAKEDAEMIARWEQEKIFLKSFDCNRGNQKFILHDGPPYANGHIHIGHAYNKILKDIITKSRRMAGMHVPVTPGWDCHGLPIELKVSSELKNASRQEMLTACRAYAQSWIDVQAKEFKDLGVLMNWQDPYLTMNYSYEAKILQALAVCVNKGYINRSLKTVPWCMSCQTVLASAEIEYAERTDPSIYVLFELDNKQAIELLGLNKPISVVVWTTTPWTLPLNQAVTLKPSTEYVVLDVNGQYLLVGSVRADDLCKKLNSEKIVIATIKSDDLAQKKVRLKHPLIADLLVPIVLDESVLLDEGTAAVHCAPGAGPEDYEIGLKNGLNVYSPVDQSGRYTDDVKPEELKGMLITHAQKWVINALQERMRLLYQEKIKHNYPCCWRCQNSLIFRATKQWFFDLQHDDLKQRVFTSLKNITTIPDNSINRLQKSIESRLEWCISRQRVWGVPIPALICNKCDNGFINKDLIDYVAGYVNHQGIEYWNNVTIDSIASFISACLHCGSDDWRKERDILDVWFDSGISHYAVLRNNADLSFPADMYLEGKDQHRGWFQSSLLTALAIEETAPMKQIVTHGFTVDNQGRKMSKSLGNVVSPQELIAKLGTDGLRLWASSIDIQSDAVVSDVLIQHVQEVYRKIRNTARFLISNLYDFDASKDMVSLSELRTLDKIALFELEKLDQNVRAAYERCDSTAVFHQLSDYCTVQLSTLYFDMIKDILYVELAHGKSRRSVQTACFIILDTLTRLMAPIMSFTAEQVSDHYQRSKTESIHLQPFAVVPSVWSDKAHTQDQLELMKQVRSAIMKSIERLREQGAVKRSLDTSVQIFIDPQATINTLIMQWFHRVRASDETIELFLKEFLIVSQVTLKSDRNNMSETSLPGLWVIVEPAHGKKCPRCWQWEVTNNPDDLCNRCFAIVNQVK